MGGYMNASVILDRRSVGVPMFRASTYSDPATALSGTCGSSVFAVTSMYFFVYIALRLASVMWKPQLAAGTNSGNEY